MAVTGTVAEGAIKIVLKGYEAAKQQLAKMGGDAKKLGDSLGTIGSASARGFAVATGGILGFLKAADPVRFTIFTQKLEILSMHIGRSFIPLLQDAIEVVDQLIGYFSNLTDEQREQILHWTKVVTVVLAAGTAMGAAVLAVSKLATGLQALSVAIKILMSSTGVGLILVLAGIAYGVYELLKATGKLDPIIEKLTEVFNRLVGAGLEPVMKVFDKVVGVVMSGVEKVMPLFEQFAALVGEVFGEVAEQFGKLLEEALPIFMELAQAGLAFAIEIGKALMSLLPPVMQVVGVLFRLWMVYQATLAKVFLAIIGGVVAVMPALTQIAGVMTEVVEQLAPVMAEMAEIIGEVLGVIAELGAEIMKLVGGALADLIKSLAELFQEFWKAFGDDIIRGIRGVVEAVRVALNLIKDMVKAAKEMAEVLAKLNPLRRQQVTERSSRTSGAGDFANGSASASGPEDFGGGAPAAGGTPSWMRDIAGAVGRAAGTAVRGAGRGGAGGQNNNFNPLANVAKVENFGLEDAFKRAQQGAGFDPAKLAEAERKKLQMQSNEYLRTIRDNSLRQPAAMRVQ